MEEQRRQIEIKKAGARFAEIRKTEGYTQRQIADYLDVDRTLITKFENGERSLSVSLLEKACKLFGCDITVISGRKEFESLAVAYRAKDMTMADMEAVAKFKNAVLNMRDLKRRLGGDTE